MRVPAFAKINLSLRVVGTRPDGYHELRTVFQSIALHDVLTVRRTRRRFELTCDDPSCPTGSANLVWRAARAVWAAAGGHGVPHGVAIHLAKRIPSQAGLGGGSSDAAATLRVLGRMWRVARPHQRALAMALGADVPFFLEGGTVLGLDRGDRLFPLRDLPRAWIVVALPPFGVSTRDAFRWFDAQSTPHTKERRLMTDPDWRNDLESVVGRRHPQIGALVGTLRTGGAAHALMSGSGSAVVALYASRGVARLAARRLEIRFPGTRTILSRTLGRAAYRRLAGT
jgi:4-diphosphocytidyl-2-C-methyl-D-erythritol kinase